MSDEKSYHERGQNVGFDVIIVIKIKIIFR